MSHRPITQKRAQRMRKAISRRPLPGFIDPVDWLRIRRYAQTTGAARKLIFAEKLKSESHPVGYEDIKHLDKDGKPTTTHVLKLVPVSQRESLQVTA